MVRFNLSGNLKTQNDITGRKINIAIDTNILLGIVSIKKIRKYLKNESSNFDFLKEAIDFKRHFFEFGVEINYYIADTVIEEFKNHLKSFFEKTEFKIFSNDKKIFLFNKIVENIKSLFTIIKINNEEKFNLFTNKIIRNDGQFQQKNFKDIKILFICIENDVDLIFAEDDFFKININDKVLKIMNFIEKPISKNGAFQSISYSSKAYDILNFKLFFGNSIGSTSSNIVKHYFENDVQFKNAFNLPLNKYKRTPISPFIIDFAENPFAKFTVKQNKVIFSLRCNLFFSDKDIVSYLKPVEFNVYFSRNGDYNIIMTFYDWELINKNGLKFSEYLHGLNSFPVYIDSLYQLDSESGLVSTEVKDVGYSDFKNSYILISNSEISFLNDSLSNEFKVQDSKGISIEEYNKKYNI